MLKMAAQCKPHDYAAGNFADRVKNSNLEFLLDKLVAPRSWFFYFEAHSGAGRYTREDGTTYDGTSLRAFRSLSSKNADFLMVLNEQNPERRQKLRSNFSPEEADVQDDWRASLPSCLNYMRSLPSLCLSDPSFIRDHVQIMDFIPKILYSGAAMFMYIPQPLKNPDNEEIIKNTRQIIKKARLQAVDLMMPSEKAGHFDRIDHNLVVALKPILEELEKNFMQAIINESGNCREISKERMKEFIASRGPVKRINW